MFHTGRLWGDPNFQEVVKLQVTKMQVLNSTVTCGSPFGSYQHCRSHGTEHPGICAFEKTACSHHLR